MPYLSDPLKNLFCLDHDQIDDHAPISIDTPTIPEYVVQDHVRADNKPGFNIRGGINEVDVGSPSMYPSTATQGKTNFGFCRQSF